jgi:low temperature requirement protein LtrA
MTMMRARGGENAGRVSPIELFFDLVFVYAITQVSHFLVEHLSWLGLVQSLVLYLAVWWVWIYTAWVTNWLDPERRPVSGALLALMLAGLVLSIAAPDAFGERGLAFALAYVTMQLGRTVFMIWAVRYDAAHKRNFQRIAFWLLLSAVFWIAGGLAQGNKRLLLWAAALGLELISPALSFWTPYLGRATTAEWDVETSHLSERCALFVIIALGESLLVTGATFGAAAWTEPAIIAFVAAFVGAAALWWIYFDTAAETTRRAFAASTNPGDLARIAYTYVHAAIVAGIVVTAVGDERLLAHPNDPADSVSAAAIIGGPALYLVSNGIFRRLLYPRFPRSHWIGLVGLIGLALAVPWLTLVQLGVATTLVLVITAASGSVIYARRLGALEPKAKPAIEPRVLEKLE